MNEWTEMSYYTYQFKSIKDRLRDEYDNINEDRLEDLKEEAM